MRVTATILLMLVSGQVRGDAMLPIPPRPAPPRYLLVWQDLNTTCLAGYGDVLMVEPCWQVKTEAFASVGEAVERMGNGRYVHISEDELVGLFDLEASKRVPVRLRQTKHSETRTVVEEPWVEYRWEAIRSASEERTPEGQP